MGRILALVLGGAGLVLFLPDFIPGEVGMELRNTVTKLLTETWHGKVMQSGAGVLAALALILLAIRGKD